MMSVAVLVDLLVGTIFLTALWVLAARLLVTVFDIQPGPFRLLINFAPLLAAIAARQRLAGDAGWVVIAIFGVYALLRMAWRVRAYRSLLRQFERGGDPSGALQIQAERLARALRIAPPRVLLVEDGNPGPLCCGWLHPLIVVPRALLTRLDAQEREALLAHELGHIAGRDTYWKCVLVLLRDLALFNPCARLPFSWANEDQEHAADRRALQVTRDAPAMMRMLIKVREFTAAEGQRQPSEQVHLVAHASCFLSRRIERMAAGDAIRESARSELAKSAVVYGLFVWLCWKPYVVWEWMLAHSGLIF